MNFLEAIKAFKEGKIVTRLCGGLELTGFSTRYGKMLGLESKKDCFDFDSRRLSDSDFEAEDWEVVEEKKTLSNKSFKICDIMNSIHDGDRIEECVLKEFNSALFKDDVVLMEDVKKSLKEFIEEMKGEYPYKWIDKKAKEIFGERLVE